MPERAPTKPALKRVLSRRDLILYGLVILTPTAAYPVFGIVQQTSHGHAALSYLIAMIAMLFTAASERAANIVPIYPMGYPECNSACR